MFRVTINADDFGLTGSCTKAICQAFSENLVTDTTMVANGEAFDEAVIAIKKYGLQDRVGIHFNITEGTPLTGEIKNCPAFAHDVQFHGQINRMKPLTKAEKQAVYEEFSAQIMKLENAGISLTHADSHHHIHTAPFIAPIFARVCKEHGITKVRLHRNIGNIPAYKKLPKKLYNRWLHRNGFITTDCFGSMEDVRKVGLLNNMEIMVHPDFDRDGKLVDRTDEADGYAVGEPLLCPTGEYEFKGYIDL